MSIVWFLGETLDINPRQLRIFPEQASLGSIETAAKQLNIPVDCLIVPEMTSTDERILQLANFFQQAYDEFVRKQEEYADLVNGDEDV